MAVAKTKSKAQGTKSGNLIIVESPTKAKKIQKFLGSGYTVIASNGHVRDLPKSTLGVNVEDGFMPSYITVRGKGDLLEKIRKEARQAKTVYLATDPDREGEAISWHLAAILKLDPASLCRIVFNEITVGAVKASLKNARAIDMNLVDAQQARRVLDRLVGYKISPLLWRKVKRGLSAGRVQSVATRMICDREREINAFISEEYWSVTAQLQSHRSKKLIAAKFYGFNGKKADLSDEAAANSVLERTSGKEFTVTDIKTSEKSKHAPAPFTTSSLQQEASRKLALTGDRTMKVAQELYEGANMDSGLITYMRTDSVRVAKEAQDAALAWIKDKYGERYAPKTPNIYKGSKNAQDAHEAIRPTDITNAPQKLKDKLSMQQFRLYKLIYERFLASQMSEALLESTAVTYDCEGCTFKTNGQRTLFDGYSVIYNEDKDELKDISLPKLEIDDKLTLSEIDSEQHFTQPPSRYTDATLVKALDELGIGRPSTYAPTISTIIARGYVRREKRVLYPTELGEIVNCIMLENFKDIVDLQFTADMEEKLDSVENNGTDWHGIISEFYSPFIASVNTADEKIEKVKIADEVSETPCDKCGAMMVYKMGRFGKFLACPNYPQCKNTKPIMQKIDTPCPVCGAAVLRRTSKGKGKVFFGCERYPDCDFVSWDLPLNEKCSVCGKYMVQRISDKGRYKTCSDKDCASNKRSKKKDTPVSDE